MPIRVRWASFIGIFGTGWPFPAVTCKEMLSLLALRGRGRRRCIARCAPTLLSSPSFIDTFADYPTTVYWLGGDLENFSSVVIGCGGERWAKRARGKRNQRFGFFFRWWWCSSFRRLYAWFFRALFFDSSLVRFNADDWTFLDLLYRRWNWFITQKVVQKWKTNVVLLLFRVLTQSYAFIWSAMKMQVLLIARLWSNRFNLIAFINRWYFLRFLFCSV